MSEMGIGWVAAIVMADLRGGSPRRSWRPTRAFCWMWCSAS